MNAPGTGCPQATGPSPCVHRCWRGPAAGAVSHETRVVEVVDALRALGGTARWKELRGHVSWRAVKHAKSVGEVVRDGDAYSLVGTARDRVVARQLRGVRSHLTAAAHHGFALPPAETPAVHITVARHARRRSVPDDVALHYRDHLPCDLDDDVTGPLATVIDCLRDEPLRAALCVGDSALETGRVALAELTARAAGLRGPRSAQVRRRVKLLDPGAANAFESSCRAILLLAGIVGFETQVTIRHLGQGRARRPGRPYPSERHRVRRLPDPRWP